MLNWPMIKKALDYGRLKFSNGHQKVDWILNTNGTIMSPRIAEVLKRENVDVHLSIDGPDIESNRYRKFKNGSPSLNKVRKNIQILKEFGCRMQFNTCLTDANQDVLDKLIDYAAQNGVDRIYLAVTDTTEETVVHRIDFQCTAQIIVASLKYANSQGIKLSGPWLRAISGSLDMQADKDALPFLCVDPSGETTFPAYPNYVLGDVNQLEIIVTSPEYEKVMTQWEKEKTSCKNCKIEDTCAGYLLRMVRYHTGHSKGCAQECSLALAIFEMIGFKNTYNTIAESKLVVSNQLFLQKHNHSPVVIHRLAQTVLKASPDLLTLLNLFQKPIQATAVQDQYAIPDFSQTISRLIQLRFLNIEGIDEEVRWLVLMNAQEKKHRLKTEHFLFYYPQDHGYLAHELAERMEYCYDLLVSKEWPPFNKRVIVNICLSRKEFIKFWGPSPLPDWLKIFVAHGRILILDSQKLMRVNLRSLRFMNGLSHELVHVFLHQHNCRLPIWLEEGLCEYFARPYDVVTFKKLAKIKGIFGFKEIELTTTHSLLDLDASPVLDNMCYRQCQSFVAYLSAIKGVSRFIECVLSTRLGSEFKERFQYFYDHPLDEAEAAWLKSIDIGGKQNSILETTNKRLQLSSYCKTIENKSRVLVYNALHGHSLIGSKDLLEILDCLDGNKTLRQIENQYEVSGFDDAISSLFKKGLLVYNKQYDKETADHESTKKQVNAGCLIDKLRLNLSHACNLSCTYCYMEKDGTPDGLMGWPVARKALDGFFELQKRHNHETVVIRFFGGEPLLNPILIEKIVSYVDTKKQGIHVNYIINTNGTIANNQMAASFAALNAVVAISIDGVGPVHDLCRKFSSGKGSFDIIDKNMDIFLSHKCKLFVETTLGEHNVSCLKELIDYLSNKAKVFGTELSLGIQSMCMQKGRQMDDCAVEQRVSRIIQAITYAQEKKVNIYDGMVQLPFNAFIGRRTAGSYCSTLGTELCVHPNGDIHPCGALNMKLGHVDNMVDAFKSPLYARIIQRISGTLPACKGCEIEGFCAGGCTADAVGIAGQNRLFEPTLNCGFEKAMFRALVNNFILN